MNLVIKVTEGKLTDIVWDNDCFACETSDTCENSTIFHYTNSTISSEYKNCKVETLCNKESEEAPKAPEVKPGEKDLFSDDEEARPVSDIEKKVEEALPKEAKSERRTEATSKLSSEDLDKLLSGETLDK